ncbi:NCAIR mutase-like protein [Candidatus Methanoperedens nitroreducens]|uniref:NCAIR mutase-like protein n=1 Tax=Candidatus Methanoperedens nitratireducens TaxID=1392998 RepID=A0A062UXN8_9EURY|nr:nickel pincer cofactor biosynthesis protein LarB [Candidatus Methanoperedens nitroreducens]KCZ71746.1 NCAIR mutase-like protein [Candidatus Methanoperedens nitroreducens]MDJ1422281.1 nickel pincer cofactor biosynthesis protein LarB [Candidatus Methanoperedens sp.]
MDLSDTLKKLKNNEISLEEAERTLRITNFELLSDIARVDIHRSKRTGIPEAIIADCKACDEVVSIARVHLKNEGRVIITRISDENYQALGSLAKEMGMDIRYSERARVVVIGNPVDRTGGRVGVISAGTADIPVAEEAKVIAQEMGCAVTTIYDVGVAGIHRLFPGLTGLVEAGVDAVVVAAGREGTLPAIVSGLIDAPVIGVPVSTGYGAGGKGEAALLSMLQSCSVLTVVNIDAGFVAGAFAARIANLAAKHRNKA